MLQFRPEGDGYLQSGEQSDLGRGNSMCKGPGVGRRAGGTQEGQGQSEMGRDGEE